MTDATFLCLISVFCVCQVASLNRFAPPPVVVAAHDHRVNITQSVHKTARLRFRCVQGESCIVLLPTQSMFLLEV